MTAAQLIEKLKTMKPEALVVLEGHDHSYERVGDVSEDLADITRTRGSINYMGEHCEGSTFETIPIVVVRM